MKVVEEMNCQEAENNTLPNIGIDPNKTIASGEGNRKNLGYAVLSKLYYELVMDIFFNNHSRRYKNSGA
ncbi:MAG: hypothetical protein LBG29_00710 [Synergistaceae bacterium]|jgi:hypothetical protein|nr:hypothetical protein [Synergistaceae bacterium]